MSDMAKNSRQPDADVDSMFMDRWSPRAMLAEPIPDHHIRMLFESARWAPSCFNEQPWEFVCARTPESRERFVGVLTEKNRQWAGLAPLLMFVVARRTFRKSSAGNRHAPFDAGAAWMSLALQARRLGYYAHAMAGFDVAKANDLLGLTPNEYDIMVAIAVGRHGNPALLPETLRQLETPNGRKPLAEVYRFYGE